MAIIIDRDGNRRYRCSDAADPNCEWESRGKDVDEIVAEVERHGMERHKRGALTEQERDRIKTAIRGDTAA